jgi:hypothetical protein
MEIRKLTRRAFSRMVAGSLLTGGVLEAAVQETGTVGGLSETTAMLLLEHIGYKPSLPQEMETLRPMLESVIRDIETIRKFDVAIAIEPAFVFRADR